MSVKNSMKTTGISSYNVAPLMQSGKVGTIRYVHKSNGQTYVRAASNSKKATTTSKKQMVQRLKYASIVSLYNLFKNDLLTGFSRKKSNNSDYQAFVGFAGRQDDCYAYMTYDQKQNDCSVALPVKVTDGKLKSIGYIMNGGNLETDIVCTITLDANTTIGAFATEIISKNAKYIQGDEIAFMGLVQQGTAAEPYAEKVAYRIILDPTSSEKLWDYAPMGFEAANGLLCAKDLVAGCFGYIHSRLESDGSFKISSQWLANNNAAMLSTMQGDVQFELAAASYGGYVDLFLRPDGDIVAAEPGPTPPGPTPGGDLTLTVKVHDGQTQMGKIKINGGEGKTEDSITVASGTSVTVQAVPTPGGEYHFVGWNDGGSDLQRTVTVTESKTLVASFEPEE